MTRKIEHIEGIGPVFAQKLIAVGVKTDTSMLERAASAKGRAALAAQTGIGESLILKWANHADLMRVKGVGPQYAELLEAAGVDTVTELAQRNAANLTARMRELNAQKNLTRKAPAIAQVSGWIAQAKRTDRKISY